MSNNGKIMVYNTFDSINPDHDSIEEIIEKLQKAVREVTFFKSIYGCVSVHLSRDTDEHGDHILNIRTGRMESDEEHQARVDSRKMSEVEFFGHLDNIFKNILRQEEPPKC